MDIAITNSAYVQYSSKEAEVKSEESEESEEKGYAGVAMQSNLQISPKQSEEGMLPVATEVEISLPRINEKYPSKVILAKAETFATSGEAENKTLDQDYDQNSGLFVISYENPRNNNSVNANTKDEFEIIYIYPEESYTGNEEEVELNYEVTVNSIYETENDLISSSNSAKKSFTYDENIGDLAMLKLTGISQKVYKGFMYSNVEDDTNYKTNFEITSSLSIVGSEDLKGLELNFDESEFELNDEDATTFSTSAVVYNSAKIKESEFSKIFGKDGSLEFYDDEKLLATVEYLRIDDEEELSIIGQDGKVEYAENGEIVVKFSKAPSSYTIKTTKPLTEGLLNIVNEISIRSVDDYGAKVSKINYINIIERVNEFKTTRKIELSEPKMQIGFTSSTTDFYVLDTNKTRLTITLSNTGSEFKLYKNPTIKVVFPEELTGGSVSSPEILNGNGLAIKDTSVDGNVMTIELEGKQTQYDLNGITGGTNITLDVENLTFPNTLSTMKSKIAVKCIQNGEEVSSDCDVTIRALEGTVLLNDFGSSLRIINNEEKTIDILSEGESKKLPQTITVVNNSGSEMENVAIVGKVNEEATFNTVLSGAVKVDSKNATIYYSENGDVWTEEYTNNAKMFKIMLGKLGAGAHVQIASEIILPANIGNNQKAKVVTELTYEQNGEQKNSFSTLNIQTEIKELEEQETVVTETVTTEEGKKLPIKLTVTPMVGQNYVHAGQFVTYKIKVVNLSSEAIENLILKDIIPQNAGYRYVKDVYDEIAGAGVEEAVDFDLTEKVWEIKKLGANGTAEFEIKLKTSEDIKEEETLSNKVILYSDNFGNIETTNSLTVKPSDILVRLTTRSDLYSNITYNSDSGVNYYINVKNVSDKTQKNIEVNFDLPKELTYINSGIEKYVKDEYIFEECGNGENNKFSYTINKLQAGEELEIIVKARVKRIGLAGKYRIEAIADAKTNGQTYESDYNTIITNQATYKLNYSSNRKNGEMLNPGDEITYTLELTNTSEISSSIKIYDSLPKYLKINNLTHYTNYYDKSELDNCQNNLKVERVIKPKDTLTVIIKATVLEQYAPVESDIEIANSIKVVFPDFEYTTSEVKVLTKSKVKEGIEEERFGISGKAWIDLNENGMLDEEDNILSNVRVTLVDKQQGKYVYDDNGKMLTLYTDKDGNYSFKNLKKGNYVVLFEYDNQMFNVTTYKKNEVNANTNSDAIQTKVVLNGVESIAGITDKIYLNSNLENIDIGLTINGEYETLYKEVIEREAANTDLQTNTDGTGYVWIMVLSILMIVASAIIIKRKIIDERF